MKDKELDNKFDAGEDISQTLDFTRATRVNGDFLSWIVPALDKEAHRVGVTRQSIINVWSSEHLQGVAL